MTGFIVMIIVTAVFALLSAAFVGIWVYKDAKQRGLSAGLWVLLILVTGIIIGLILYLLIGRRQEHGVCDKCGSATSIQGTFCSVCGERITASKRVIKKNKGLIVACIACIVLVFVSVGMSLYFYFTADGFAIERQFINFHYGLSSSAKNVSQSSSDNTWEFSYDEASGGYMLAKTYNASSRPVSLSVDIHCTGSVQLIVTQNGVSINETLVAGNYHYDMTDFEIGKINLELINIDSTNLSGKMVVETDD